MIARQFEQIHRAIDVSLDIQTRFFQRRTDAGARGKMHNAIVLRVVECRRKRIRIANVSFNQVKFGFERCGPTFSRLIAGE